MKNNDLIIIDNKIKLANDAVEKGLNIIRDNYDKFINAIKTESKGDRNTFRSSVESGFNFVFKGNNNLKSALMELDILIAKYKDKHKGKELDKTSIENRYNIKDLDNYKTSILSFGKKMIEAFSGSNLIAIVINVVSLLKYAVEKIIEARSEIIKFEFEKVLEKNFEGPIGDNFQIFGSESIEIQLRRTDGFNYSDKISFKEESDLRIEIKTYGIADEFKASVFISNRFEEFKRHGDFKILIEDITDDLRNEGVEFEVKTDFSDRMKENKREFELFNYDKIPNYVKFDKSDKNERNIESTTFIEFEDSFEYDDFIEIDVEKKDKI